MSASGSGVRRTIDRSGVPLLGVLAATQGELFDGVRTAPAVDAVILLAAAGPVAAGLLAGRTRQRR
ncbi:hypothetical protein [Streptomyces sp. H27-C3]|uniref:hypothetical protein n=1 Tax=Streptomyces sp. H27-C3 TaxID=3046305 RepID=UPI0024BA8024|nr:hypothetical protein [Streptomyces sp. H27-C3]MDJ0464512.1 hypothetical protein [Streptomyces sp. H27-C3]